jgi:predicted DNA-binding transcriptional regulator AlpA
MTNRLISVCEFKSRYSISHSKFYREVRSKRIPIRKMSRSTRIAESDAQAWFEGLPVINGRSGMIERQASYSKVIRKAI